MTLEELDLEEGPNLATLEEALLMAGEPEQDAEGDDDPIKVPAYIVRAAKQGQRLRKEHGVGAQSAPEGETPQGVVSARMLASGKVTRGFVRSKMLPFLTRHLKQVASNNERKSPGWQNASDPSPRWVALLLWGENGNGRAFRWAQSVTSVQDALVTDADFSTSACLSFELDPDDVQAWRDLQAAVAEIVPLEGYDAGDPAHLTPHSTILYYGDVRKSNRPHVLRAVVNALAAHTAPTPEPLEVTTFDAAPDGRVPVIIELAPTGLTKFYKAVLVACAPYVTATQFPKYRPHITLGYARPMPEQIEAIKALTVPTLKPFPEITLQWQGAPALHLPLESP
jgi:2'-5' RNA ligase